MSTKNYRLNAPDPHEHKEPILTSLKRFAPFLKWEGGKIAVTSVAVIISSLSTLVAPVIIGHAVDTYIVTKDYREILYFSALLFLIFSVGSVTTYIQTKSMGGVGRRVLFNLRNAIFMKLQELPVSFFHQNRAGDLISRINNDTDKLNQFIAQGLIQFVGNIFLMAGTGVFMLVLSFRLGIATLLPALGVLIITQLISPWVKRKNLESLRSLGGMSSEIQESLNNFKVIVAFNRLDYFRKKFQESNDQNYTASIGSGIASNIFLPIYGLASNLAQLTALCFGIYLIMEGNLTLGLLIGFQFYVGNFYNPLRQLAAMWSSFQLSLASLDRISEVLSLESDLVMPDFIPTVSSPHPQPLSQGERGEDISCSWKQSHQEQKSVFEGEKEDHMPPPPPGLYYSQKPSPNLSQEEGGKKLFPEIPIFSPLSSGRGVGGEGSIGEAEANIPVLEFRDVSFHYPEGQDILSHTCFRLERGKTYAIVGPTGGGKTTTAALMTRLYDPTSGTVLLDGKDIRTYAPEERTKKIGFILQEPFLFSGTIRDNIFYGHEEYIGSSADDLDAILAQSGFSELLSRFPWGPGTRVANGGESISLGQKQLIAFMRAVLRKPELLILDEATANIDTVTEQFLENILEKLPAQTTKVIIAHRLNTIKNADQIFFVNTCSITSADSVESTLDMLLHGKRVG